MRIFSGLCALGAGGCFGYSLYDIVVRRQCTAQDAFILGLILLIVGLGTHKAKA